MSSASSACLPRIRSASGRTLRALIRANRCTASYAMRVRGSGFRVQENSLAPHCSPSILFLLSFTAVSAERPRGGELAQFVADHVFGHEHLRMHLAVVHHKRVADELGHDRASTGPSL